MISGLPHNHGQNVEVVLAHLPSIEDCNTSAQMFKLVSDGVRLRIFMMLCHCEECVSNIAAAMEMSDPAISHHLKLLRQAGLITSRREGKEVFYKAAESEPVKLLHLACEEMFDLKCPFDCQKK